MDASESITISVVVVAYRQREELAACLQACAKAASRVAGATELIVVDNGGLAPFVRELGLDARIIEPGENTGFAGGVHRGIETAAGAWVALVNDDARIEPEALSRLLAAGELGERIGSVAAQVRFQANPSIVNSAGINLNSLGVATERLAGRPIAEAERAGEVFGASGCFVLYRMAMLKEIGDMDERFFAYLEDVDLAWRARAASWSCVYEPRAIAYHRGSASTGEGSRRKYFLVGRNRVRLLARNATTGQIVRALPGIVLFDLAYIVYAALSDRTLAPLRGRIAGLAQWRVLRRETERTRQPVALSSASRGWIEALRMRRAYRSLGARE